MTADIPSAIANNQNLNSLDQNKNWIQQNPTITKILAVAGIIFSSGLLISLPFSMPIWGTGLTVGLAVSGVLLTIASTLALSTVYTAYTAPLPFRPTIRTISEINSLQQKMAPDIASHAPVGIVNSGNDCFFIAVFQSIIVNDQKFIQAFWNKAQLEPSDLQIDESSPIDLLHEMEKLSTEDTKSVIDGYKTVLPTYPLALKQLLEIIQNSNLNFSQLVNDLNAISPAQTQNSPIGKFIQFVKVNAKIAIRQFMLDYSLDQHANSEKENCLDVNKTRNFRKAFCILFNTPHLESGQQDAPEVLYAFLEGIEKDIQQITAHINTYFKINGTPVDFNVESQKPIPTHLDYDSTRQLYYRKDNVFFNGTFEIPISESVPNSSLQRFFNDELSAAGSSNELDIILSQPNIDEIFNQWKAWYLKFITLYPIPHGLSKEDQQKRQQDLDSHRHNNPVLRTHVRAECVTTHYSAVPPQLLIQLKRFKSDHGISTKIDMPVDVESEIVLPGTAIDALQAPDTIYELQGFSAHNGGTIESGHFVAYVKRGDGYYYLDLDCMGSKVVSKSRQEFLQAAKNAYLLKYVKKEGAVSSQNSETQLSLDKISILKPWSILKFGYTCFSDLRKDGEHVPNSRFSLLASAMLTPLITGVVLGTKYFGSSEPKKP